MSVGGENADSGARFQRDEFVSVPKKYILDVLDIVTLNLENEPSVLLVKDVRLGEGMSLTLFSEGLLLESGRRGETFTSHSHLYDIESGKSVLVAIARPILKWISYMTNMTSNDFKNSFAR